MSGKIEIAAGLKQAIERGSSLEQAKASFTNAGFNSEDVEEAAKELTGFATQLPQVQYQQQSYPQPKLPQFSNKSPQIPQLPPMPQVQKSQQNQQFPQLPQFPQQLQQIPKKKNLGMLILIIGLAIILIGLLGVLLGFFFFKPQLIDILSKIGINLPA